MSVGRIVRRVFTGVAIVVVAAACSVTEDGTGRADRPAEDTGAVGAASPLSPRGTGSTSSSRKVDPRKNGFEIGFGEFAITLEADAIRPGPVTFVIRNGGALVHGFEIKGEDVNGDHSGPGNGELELEGPEFGPGGIVRLRADLAPGVYELECFVADHDDRGMRATLIVAPDAPLVRTDPGHSAPGTIEIADFAFAPNEAHVPPGTEVTWTNVDPAPHAVTDEAGTFDSGTIDPQGTFTFRFDRPGSYRYACSIHPTMRGTVHVA